MRTDEFISLVGGDPVRKVVRRSHAGFVGYFHSRKFGRVEYEWHLERDFVRLCEVDPSVTFLKGQPLTIFWTDDFGVVHSHVPDFALIRDGLPMIVEVKPAKKAEQFTRRTEVVTRQLARKGIVYEVVTEALVRREPALSNASELLMGLGYEPAADFIDSVLGLLIKSENGLSISEVIETLGVAADARYAIYALILDGVVALVEPDAPVTVDSRVIEGGGP